MTLIKDEVIKNIHEAQEMIDGSGFSFPWKNFSEVMEERTREHSNKTFLIYYDDDKNERCEFSYKEFNDFVNRTSNLLIEDLHVKRGDKVSTILFNHYYTVFIYFACWKIGACVVPINIEEDIDRKTFILENSESRITFCWIDSLKEIESIKDSLSHLEHIVTVGGISKDNYINYEEEVHKKSPAFISKDSEINDDALIVYTSGTTGPPKGVILSQYNLLIDADGISEWHHFNQEDRLMCILPIHHVNGTIVTLVTPYYMGGSTVLNRKFKSSTFWKKIHTDKVNCVSVVPTILEFLLEANEDISKYSIGHFKWIICGAGPLLVETALNFQERFNIPIIHGYGLSETTCYSCFLPTNLRRDELIYWLSHHKFPSIGIPIKHNDMAIIDEKGNELKELEKGEIVVKGRTVIKGYFKRPDANKDAFKFGWFRTGDEGFYKLDKQKRKFFFITGRIKELIIRGGINISPLEVDDVLKSHPKVRFGMAVPFENRYYGEEIAAYIVPKNGIEITEKDVLEYCKQKLDFKKQPKVVIIGSDVPYTSTGKPKRLELKEKLKDELHKYRDIQFSKK